MKKLLIKLFLSRTSALHWTFSDQASNFGTFLLGVTTIIALPLSLFYLHRFRKEKRLEKRSDISEESLNCLDSLIFSFNDWISSSSFVYSKYSKASQDQYEKSPESVKDQLQKMYNDDPLELHNHCKNFKKIMGDFFKSKNKVFHLANNDLDSKFEELEKILQTFPNKLGSYHHLNDRHDIPNRGSQMAKNWLFINQDGPKKVMEFSENIKPSLREIILYKNRTICFTKIHKAFSEVMNRIKRKLKSIKSSVTFLKRSS